MGFYRRGVLKTLMILGGLCAALMILQADAFAQGAGQLCRSSTDCSAGLQCADGRRCAPVDRTGGPGAYCHHDNHCVTGRCNCDHGAFGGFCKDWERWPPGQFGSGAGSQRIGFCTGKQANGGPCRNGSECTSGHCADGQRCAPRDRTGTSGAYCHHNNHCVRTSQCICPAGQSFGFCANWENVDFLRAQELNKARTSFFCR